MDQRRLDIESLLYRTEKLDGICSELKHLVSGTGEDYTGLLKTRTGKYSSRSVSRMIEDLIACLTEYRSYTEAVRKGHKAGMVRTRLPNEDRKFYEAYFYLMLGLATHDNSGFYTRYCRPGTWDALLDRVNEPVEYDSPAALDCDLILYDIGSPDPLRIPSGLFVDMCDAYRTVTGEDLSSLLSDKERKAAYKLMTKDELFYAKNPAKRLEDYNRALAEADLNGDKEFLSRLYDDLEKIRREDPGIDEDPLSDDDLGEYYGSTEENWTDYFADTERFLSSCLTVKNGILERVKKGYSFRKEISTAVKLYLWKNNISKISDDGFYTVYIYIERARDAAAKKLSDDRK